MSDMKEVSKAAAEAAKFGTKALDVTEKVLSFVGKVFREPVDQVSGIISDRLKLFRWQRQVRMADKVGEILQSRNIKDTIAVPPKFALPILEAASLEENDDLQNLWATLLANAMDPKSGIKIEYSYIDILKSLNPTDVKLLNTFYGVLEKQQGVDWSKISSYPIKKEQMIAVLELSEQNYYMSVCNLFRVQCLAPAILTGGVSLGKEPVTIYKGQEQVVLTVLGLELIKASIKNN
jgi:hypothetical protein